jgi:hypothetical protein
MRRRGELLERPNALLYDTGGMRRTHLRGHGNILKRLLVHVAACNLGLWMRIQLTTTGTLLHKLYIRRSKFYSVSLVDGTVIGTISVVRELADILRQTSGLFIVSLLTHFIAK